MSQKFTVTIDMGNAAFDDDAGGDELARILREIAADVRGRTGPYAIAAFDSNGNRVGEYKITGRRT